MRNLKVLAVVGLVAIGSWLMIPSANAETSSGWLVLDSAAAQAGCGPGPHWIDNCPAGTDNFSSTTALVGLNFSSDPNDCTTQQTLTLTGPVVVRRAQGVPHKIDPTEITNMALAGAGFTLRVGINTPGINANVRRSLGAIIEKSNDPTIGQSFFEVFFEIIGGPAPLYNQQALRIAAEIDRVPPRAVYLHPVPLCLPLFTSPIPGQGTVVAKLVKAEHNTGVPTATEWGLIALTVLLAGSLAVMIRRRFSPRPAGA